MRQVCELRLILNSVLGSLTKLGWSIAILALMFCPFVPVLVQLTGAWLTDEMDGEEEIGSSLEGLRARLEPVGSVHIAVLLC